MIVLSSTDCAVADLRRRDFVTQAGEARLAVGSPARPGVRVPAAARSAFAALVIHAGGRLRGTPSPAVANIAPRPALSE